MRWTVSVARLAIQRRFCVDQGSEFVSRDLDLWAYMKGVTLDFSRPGTPTDNALSGKFRAECLNQHWFMSLQDAVGKCETCCRDYYEARPYNAIGNKPPISLVNRSAAHGPPWPAGTGWRPAGWSKNG